jgi:predicted DNA-binding transcriptional regulator YafY
VSSKRDRANRLDQLAHLLVQHPDGLSVVELAEQTGVTRRTVYRDLAALPSALGISIWRRGRLFGTDSSGALPPLQFTLMEAVTFYHGANLLAGQGQRHDQQLPLALGKLAAVPPPTVAPQLEATRAVLAERPFDDHLQRIFAQLAVAWAGGRKVRVWYRQVNPDGQPTLQERTVAPYLIEPNPLRQAAFLIGYDDLRAALRAFRIDRIEQVELTDELVDSNLSFDADGYLRQSLSVPEDQAVEVRLRFHQSEVAARAAETRWHPSQRRQPLGDGRVDLLFELNDPFDLANWVLSWADAVEVLDPPELRQYLAELVARMLAWHRPGTGAAPG